MSRPLDVLAEVFVTTRVGGAIFGEVELSGECGMAPRREPWARSTRKARAAPMARTSQSSRA